MVKNNVSLNTCIFDGNIGIDNVCIEGNKRILVVGKCSDCKVGFVRVVISV